MSIFNDTNNSINEILEMLKNYRTEGKPNTSSFHEQTHSTASHEEPSFSHLVPHQGMTQTHTAKQQAIFQQTHSSARRSEAKLSGMRLHSSLQHMPKRREERLDSPNIFSRLYEEDKALRERREQLFVSGRKQQEHEASKQCTFSPHLRQKSGKNMTQDVVEGFYQKNIDWQRKVQKETKLKQCEKINEGVAGLTFTPKINTRRDKPNKENVPLLQKKGVEQFLHRQQRAKHCIQTLQSRKKNPYTQIWNFKKCQFSYLH